MENEIWKSIPDYEGYYEASSLGRIRSLPRICKTSLGFRQYGGRILNPYCTESARRYLFVGLSKYNKTRQLRIHRLVLLAFRGEAPEGHECCHTNGKPHDNRLVNLRWDLHTNNLKDRDKHGKWKDSIKARKYRLNWQKVGDIRASTKTQEKLSVEYEVSLSCISDIKRFKTWKQKK